MLPRVKLGQFQMHGRCKIGYEMRVKCLFFKGFLWNN